MKPSVTETVHEINQTVEHLVFGYTALENLPPGCFALFLPDTISSLLHSQWLGKLEEEFDSSIKGLASEIAERNSRHGIYGMRPLVFATAAVKTGARLETTTDPKLQKIQRLRIRRMVLLASDGISIPDKEMIGRLNRRVVTGNISLEELEAALNEIFENHLV